MSSAHHRTAAYAAPPRRDWSARGDSNPDLHGLNVPRLPIAPRADDNVERMAGFEPAPQGLEGPQATVTPHSLWYGPVSFTGPSTVRQLSKTPLVRANVTSRLDRFEDKTSPRPDAVFLPHVRPKPKRPSRGSPWKAWFSMNAGPLRRFAPLGVIKRAAALAADPRLCHGSAHTHGDSLDAGQTERPRYRWVLRIGESCRHVSLVHQCTTLTPLCQ